jgi:alpha-methylacyl-CoA racemase
VIQPAPAPRFDRSAADSPAAPPRPGADTDDVLTGLGLSAAEVSGLRARGVVG